MPGIIPELVDNVCDAIGQYTKTFYESKLGQLLTSLVLIGPLTFLPTVWVAWTADNIDALRTMTWPMMTFINLIIFVSLCNKGDWQVRSSTFFWFLLVGLVAVATLVR